MNKQAEKHLDRAQSYLVKGDGWYEKAADEIIAAQKADPTLTQREIGKRFDKSHQWVSKLVAWRTTGHPGEPISWGPPDRNRESKAKVEARVDELPPAEKKRVVEKLISDPKVISEFAGSDGGRKLYKASEEALQERAEPVKRKTRQKQNEPHMVYMKVAAAPGALFRELRLLGLAWQDLQAVGDEDQIEAGREHLIELKAGVITRIDKMLTGDWDAAWADMQEEVQR